MVMPGCRPNCYVQWRTQNESRLLLRERDASQPPERLLQNIWCHQRLQREQLKTLDGQPVRILHPGFWNREAGPDFRGAVVQIGHDAARSGDVEIDLVPGNWRAHHHDSNPAYANVILHVIWNGVVAAEPAIPSMALEKFLDAPLADIQNWVGSAGAPAWPESLQGACNGPLGELSQDQAVELLHQAARVRFERKAREFEIRARQSGWEQALWEGLFRGLGYKQNVWPMQRLAELLPRLCDGADAVVPLQARLLGVSGLLTAETGKEPPREDAYFRALWDHWWRERGDFADVTLPHSLWRFNGLRPANQPHRRLALAAHWLSSKKFLSRLEQWFTDNKFDTAQPESLLACLQPPADDFWSWHWGLRTAHLPKPQPLLGATRATDLAINVILPWFWIRAQSGKNHYLEQSAWERFLEWPAAQDNALLRLARQRLLGGRGPGCVKTAATQQGLLQIVRDFCDHSNAICTDCQFPNLVRSCVV